MSLSRVLFASIFIAFTARAQWTTATVDGVINPANEYGSTQNGTNQIGAGSGQTWYMTWDGTNLYVGITGANLSEGAVIYVGFGGAGNISGQNYDGTGFSSLPFPAQFVAYFKDGYNEYRTWISGSGWSNAVSNNIAYASNAASGPNTREVAIPWTAITSGGGLPQAFNFFGYLTSSSGYIYGQVPNDNPGASIGSSATYTQYFSVASTANGAGTPPFSNEQSSGFSAADKAGFYHNTFDPMYRSIEGAAPEASQVTIGFRTLHSTGASSVTLRAYIFDTGSGNTTGPVDTNMPFSRSITVNGAQCDFWQVTLPMPSSPSVYYYKFRIKKYGGTVFYSDDYIDDYDNLNKDGAGAPYDTEPSDSFQITVYVPAFQTPAWMASASIYQIFPDRFRNGDPTNDYCAPGSTSGCPSFYGAGSAANIAVTPWNTLLCDPHNSSGICNQNFGSIFYGGDLLGIQKELDYIQGLGFDTIYLTPVFEASSNHRYDTDDYFTVDPALGGNAALASLLAEMNRRGMRVILDAVFNHASSDSTYFNRYNRFPDIGACQSLSSPWRTWFHFNDNNVPCTTADYPGWAGVDSLPSFDHTQTAVQNFFYSSPTSVMATWYNAGASGWRFDVAPDPNFPHAWWVGTRQFAKGYKSDGPLIGEIWPNASQWLAGDQLDSTMNYRFRRNVTGFARGQFGWVDDNDNGNDSVIPLTPSQFDAAMRAVRDDDPPQANSAMMNLMDSHDTNRALYVLTELGDNGLTQAKQRLELAALFQFTYIGAPTVFYGDEAAINAPSRYNSANGPVGDPYARAPYPWVDQPGDPTVYGPPDQTVIAFYTMLGHLRKQYPELWNGNFVTLLTGDTQQPSTAPNTYAYARVGAGQTAIIALNNGSATNTPVIPVGAYYPDGATLQDALSLATYNVSGGSVSPTLNPISGVVLLPFPASVDLTPPTGAITLEPAQNANGWNNASPVAATITGSDSGGSGVSQVRYWVDNGTVLNNAPAIASVAGEGRHTVGARVIDKAGNISPLISSTVNIDLTPPVITIAATPATVTGTITDALSGVDASSASMTITDSQGQLNLTQPVGIGSGGSYSLNISLTAARQYTIAVNAKDLAGNSASATTTVTVPPGQ